jgi:hypothetical protein
VKWLGSLLPRDLRAFIALMASIGGTMALTIIAVWITWILWRGGWSGGTELARIDKIGLIAVLVIIIMGVTMTSLGLAINRRSVKGGFMGASFEATGGDGTRAKSKATRTLPLRSRAMITRLSLPAFGLIMLSACGAQQHAEPIKVVAESRQCPALPQMPADLMQPPRKTDFLPKTP